MGGKNDYNPAFTISPLQGIRERFEREAVEVVYQPGVHPQDNYNQSGFPKALQAANNTDMTVVVVGMDGDNEGEGHDRQNTSLVGAQSALVQAIMHAIAPQKVVVVFVNGGSLSPDWIKHHCPTVVEAMYGGQSGGTALAEVLAGDVSPSGILPYTMYPVGYLDQVFGLDLDLDCHNCENAEGIFLI